MSFQLHLSIIRHIGDRSHLKKDVPVTNGDVVICSFEMMKNKKSFRDFDFVVLVRYLEDDPNEDSQKNHFTITNLN